MIAPHYINIAWEQMLHKFPYNPSLTLLELINAVPSRYDYATAS